MKALHRPDPWSWSRFDEERNLGLDSVRRLAEELPDLDAVLAGDGWPVFRDGSARLRELLAELEVRS